MPYLYKIEILKKNTEILNSVKGLNGKQYDSCLYIDFLSKT